MTLYKPGLNLVPAPLNLVQRNLSRIPFYMPSEETRVNLQLIIDSFNQRFVTCMYSIYLNIVSFQLISRTSFNH